MSRALKNSAEFIQEVAVTRRLWTVRGLSAAQRSMTGDLAQPFWSSLERVRHAVALAKSLERDACGGSTRCAGRRLELPVLTVAPLRY